MDNIRKIRAHYEPLMSPGRESYEVVDWASAASQRRRFEVLVSEVPLEGKALLDVGCGMGDLAAFLAERDIPTAYTGVDVLEKMIRACRQRFRDRRFVRADVFADEPFPPESFDVVFCSGVFNLNLGNNLEFLPGALGKLLALSREHVVLNFLHVRSPVKEEQYFFYDPQEVLELLRGHPCEVRLLDDYLPNDFTLICRKGGAGG